MGARPSSSRVLTPAPSPGRRGEQGYSLVVLVIAVTVLNILVAAMLPLWSTAIQREKEEELIFRGFQYAEAIRVYRIRFQHPPNRLEELIEVKPRCIRQLWKDPMTEDGKWAIIFENGPQAPLQVQLPADQGGGGNGGNGNGDGDGDGGDGQGTDDNGRPRGIRKGEEVQVGPIIGVHSKSGKKSKLLFYGRERYDEWQFTERLLLGNTQPVNVNGAGVPPPPGGLTFSTRWLGRPMPGFDQQQPAPGVQDGTLPNGTTPGKPGGTRPPQRGKPGGASNPRGLS